MYIPVKHGMSKPCCIVNNTVCVYWTGHDALISAHINDVTTPPIVRSWKDIISLMFFIQPRARNFSSYFPVNDLYHDSIGNKLFGFVFSHSDELIAIGICGMRSADQDHRIISEPIAGRSFLESGPCDQRLLTENCNCLEWHGSMHIGHVNALGQPRSAMRYSFQKGDTMFI